MVYKDLPPAWKRWVNENDIPWPTSTQEYTLTEEDKKLAAEARKLIREDLENERKRAGKN